MGRLRQARVLGGDVAQDKAKQVEEVSQSMDASGKQPWVDQPLSPLVVAGEVKVFDTSGVNHALNKLATQSSTYIGHSWGSDPASKAVNGNLGDFSQPTMK